MKIYHIFFIIATFLLCISCQKNQEDILPPPNNNDTPPCIFCDTTTSKLEVIWQQPLHPDTLETISTEPIVADNGVIFTNWPKEANEEELIRNYNTLSGVIQWQRFGPPNAKSTTKRSLFNYNNNILYKASSKDICLFEHETGAEIWSHHPNEQGMAGGTRLNVIDGYYYREQYQGNNDNRISHLVQGEMETGNRTTIFSEGMEDGFTPRLNPPVLWTNSHGEKILFFRNQRYNWSNNDTKADVFLYNMEKEELEYEWNDVAWSNNNLYIFDDKIYSTGNDTMYCIDIISKEIIWREYVGQYGFSNFFVEKNVLIVNPDNRTIMGLNPHTGETIWHETDSGSTCSNMTYFDGIVYFGSLGRGLLYAVDIETGEHIWAEKSPNKDKFSSSAFVNGVAIDTINRVLYTDDEYFVMAIKLPER